ncbi:Dihydrofolate reductase-like protein [Drosera capensis]
MGTIAEDLRTRKPRFLCLHGFRTSGEILRKQVGKWPESVLRRLDLVFVDGKFLAMGKSDVEGVFEGPYFEWFQFNKDFTEYTNFDECLQYIEECMIKFAPIDGFLGFSQGAILSAALPAMQAKGIALTRVPKVKFLIIIGGAKFRLESLAQKLYSSPIDCTSIHFLGKDDFLRPHGTELLKSFADPFIIHHPKGHTVPRIDDQNLPTMLRFLAKIEKTLFYEEEKTMEIAIDVLEAQ